MMGIHDGLHNGKTDAGPAVFSGPRFIHLIELHPQVGKRLLGDRRSRVKYRYPDLISISRNADHDFFLPSGVMDGIAQIVGHHFFDLKFICPDPHRAAAFKLHLCFRLLDHDPR